jgi:hypothetical protein
MSFIIQDHVLSYAHTPICTVAVPVAILHEPITQVVHTLDEIARAAQYVGPIQLLVWCNAVAGGDRPAQAEAAFQVLHETVRQRDYATSGVMVRLVLDLLPSHFMQAPIGFLKKIKQVRTDYMRAIIDDFRQARITADHPVIWFDADTMAIEHQTLAVMVRALRANEAYFVKGHLSFTGSPADRRPLRRRDAAEQVAAIYSAVIEACEQGLGPYDPREYVEECGLAFKLSTYQAIGGLARSRDPRHGEARVLLQRARRRLDRSIPLVAYMSEARHATSYRRIQALAERLPVEIIPLQVGEAYLMQSDLHTIAKPRLPVPVTQASITMMIEGMLAQRDQLLGRNPLSRQQRQRLAVLIRQTGLPRTASHHYGLMRPVQSTSIMS